MKQIPKALRRHSPEVLKRAMIEYRIVRRLLQSLIVQGYSLSLDYDEEEPVAIKSLSQGLEMAFNLDDTYIFAKKGSKSGWVRLVFGNDGYDVISDYTTNLEDVLAPINDYSDKLGDAI